MTDTSRNRLFESLAKLFRTIDHKIWHDEEENKVVHTFVMGDLAKASANSYEMAVQMFCKALVRGSFPEVHTSLARVEGLGTRPARTVQSTQLFGVTN